MKLTPKLRAKAAVGSMIFRAIGDGDSASKLFSAAFTGQWEGEQSSRMRSRPGRRMAAQDTDLNYGTREGLLSEARSLEQTYPIAKHIKSRFAAYCVGRCRVRWNTGDRNIDKIYRGAWDDWMQVCDYKGLHRFPKLMKLAVSQGFSDGDMFVQWIDASGFSMIDLIEADRVSSNGIFNTDVWSARGPEMVGGVGIEPTTGRAKFIRVWQRTNYGTFLNPVEIPASDYFHYFDTKRVDAKRGVTGYHCVLNALRDLKEIDDAQRAKTKNNSKLAMLAKLITGPKQKDAMQFFSDDAVKTDEAGNVISVQQIGDAATAYLFPQEDMKVHQSNDPGEAWQKHMEFIVRLIALGVDLPFGVVWSMAGLNKPGVLFELNQAARTIQEVQDGIEDRLIRPIVGRWLSKEISNKRLPFNPNWFNFSVARPSYITIDAGRDSVAAINENKMGMKSLAKWYDETEDYWIDEIDQCVAERKYLEDACKLAGIDPNNVRMMNNNPGNESSQAQDSKNAGND